GHVLFVTGAGISIPSKLPNFRELVLQVFERLDSPTYQRMANLTSCKCFPVPLSGGLNAAQSAELLRFHDGEYDVCLGMLERRMEGRGDLFSQVRQEVIRILAEKTKPNILHRALIRLADRGETSTIVTTNFDR